ncbi:uroporphyrinogen-III C-methyltransferase [Photobacterium sp. Alg240-V54]|uniref:uroporphyrinogen-III C-methyltransferase n=1 Tax=Photobacterium sp. Alg240-V54 TaxID=2305995 RepID=UPI0013D3E677|nr:uroporphyrinogen-III C-methyltransferase [Photobacterium sp. Alg240-V54]
MKPLQPQQYSLVTNDAEIQWCQVIQSKNSLSHSGTVTLVGAGPGDPDLLTLKALKTLEQADVVVYDRLVSAAIMALIPARSQTLCVGKAKGQQSMTQTGINQLLVRLAQKGKHVCRLKGGDAFVFGRGGEEIHYLRQHSIKVDVVPGITAASGCSAYAGIPLTHRGVSQGCTLVTVHAEKDLDIQWQALANLNHTLVFYMGLSKVDLICQQLVLAGLKAATPAAIIEKGCTAEQRLISATLATLTEQVNRHQVCSPALIIIGEVVSLSDSLAWYQPQMDALMSMNKHHQLA